MNKEKWNRFAHWCFEICDKFSNQPHGCHGLVGMTWIELMAQCPILNEIQRRWERLEDEG